MGCCLWGRTELDTTEATYSSSSRGTRTPVVGTGRVLNNTGSWGQWGCRSAGGGNVQAAGSPHPREVSTRPSLGPAQWLALAFVG